MMQQPKHSKAIAYLRQLCCLGLSKEAVIPEFLRAVQSVLPSNSNTFTGVDERLMPAYHILGFDSSEIGKLTAIVMPNYFTLEKLQRTAQWFSQHPVLTDPTVWDESFYRFSDLYNLVMCRCDQYYGLSAPVLCSGKPQGMLNLFRPKHQKPFDVAEQALFLRLLPYLSHALRVPDSKTTQYSESGSTGLLIMDVEGTIQYQSHAGKLLLNLACNPVFNLDEHAETALLAKLAHLCRNLGDIFQGKDAAPPTWCLMNGRGCFVFRAYWLDRQHIEPGGLIGMTIEHQEPLTLKILHAMRNLPLSPAQKDVAILLAQGNSNEKIGEHLHIKLTTVKDHVRKIFVKLDIDRREDFLPKLLALDKPVPIKLH
jgi:DNA-binding CsgD family transcriptional regulator